MDISLRQIGKLFGSVGVLANVDLDIASGELMALLGPSGSGKTTLLRLMAGLEQPTSGRVMFGAEDASGLSVQDRRVGFVFQHYALFRHMSVLENVAFGLKVRASRARPDKASIVSRCRQLLNLVQLDDLESRYPSQLSGGQRQRVALARALAVEPRVLLLDEPFGALDAKVRKDLRRWLREIHDRTGITTVFVTHDQDEALELADRVAVLDQGRIEQVGTPDAVYDSPASPFVYRFIGEASAISVEIRGQAAFLGESPLYLPVHDLPSGPATLFVRPHDVGLAEAGSAAVTAQVLAVRRAGATRRAVVTVSTGTPFEIDVPTAVTFRAGDRIPVKVMRGRIFPGVV
jgi:sulfate/thiosulfate transport system ATP-binding protein